MKEHRYVYKEVSFVVLTFEREISEELKQRIFSISTPEIYYGNLETGDIHTYENIELTNGLIVKWLLLDSAKQTVYAVVLENDSNTIKN